MSDDKDQGDPFEVAILATFNEKSPDDQEADYDKALIMWAQFEAFVEDARGKLEKRGEFVAAVMSFAAGMTIGVKASAPPPAPEAAPASLN